MSEPAKCPICDGPMFKRSYEVAIEPRYPDGKRITEFCCVKCDLHFNSLGGEANFNPVPTCFYCKEPAGKLVEIRTETIFDTFRLIDGKFEYDENDSNVDGDVTELVHEDCNEYPGDGVNDWFQKRRR